jgi:peptidoglycan/xylan/chitin deacetylase (PgdA/CDA1 family)
MTSNLRHREHLGYSRNGVTLLLLSLHVGPLVLGWYCGWPWAVAGLIVVELALTYCTVFPHSRLFGRAIRYLPYTERAVILTIDDGPCDDTEEILGILATHRARAVFFLIGERAEQRPQDVQRIIAAGHLIGNHTHTHQAYWYWSFPTWRQRRELSQCQRTLSSISGTEPTLFRAPVGMRNPYCNLVAAEFSLKVIGWQARGFDGVNTPVEKIISLIRRRLCPGAIVLLHQGMPHSPAVLLRVLEMLEEDHWVTALPEAWLSASPAVGTPQANC